MILCEEIHTLEVCSNPPTKESSCAG